MMALHCWLWRALSTGCAAVAIPLLAANAAGSIVYVDNSSTACSDVGPGTEAQPYCTISAAVGANRGPGVTVYVKPGIYRESITVSGSGVAGNPYVIKALGGPVVLDGSDDFSFASLWTPYSGNVYRASSVSWSPKQVFVDGVRLQPSTAAPASLPANSFVWISKQGLYVNIGGPNPGTHTILVGRRTRGFYLSARSYVTIDGFTVTRNEDRGIYLNTGSNYNIIRSNICTWNFRYGIYVSGSAGVLVEKNVISDNADHGILLSKSSSIGSTGCTVQDNESMRNIHPTVRRATGILIYGSPGNLIQRNRLHNNQDSGLQIETGADDCRSIQNMSWNNGDHGFDQLYATGVSHVGDVAYNNLLDGFSIEGNASNGSVFDCIAIDNGLTTNEFNLWVNDSSSAGFSSDRNIFWNSTPQQPIKFINTLYSTIAAFSAETGHDARSIQADPRFVNPAAGDFHLLAGSPAIDAADSGVPNWPATDAEGQARRDDPAVPNTGQGPVPYADLGALERLVIADEPPVVTAPATATVAENSPLTVDVTASDPDSPAIDSLTVSGLPAGATFVPGSGNTTGRLSWTPTFNQAGLYTVTFRASNTRSGSSSMAITVTNMDRAPVITVPTTAAGPENGPLTIDLTASDADGDTITSLTASGLPSGATFSVGPGRTSGTIAWTPTYYQAGSYTVTFTASNALSGSAATALTITNVDRAPVVTAPATAGVLIGSVLTVSVKASDPDMEGIASLTAAGLPAGATFTPDPGDTTGTLSWTPAAGQEGSYTATFTAANLLSASAPTVITVFDSPRPPVVTAPTTASGRALSLLTVSVTASDSDGVAIASLTADLSGLPAGASFAASPDNSSGTLSWTPVANDADSSYQVIFTAENGLSGSATTTITVTGPDAAPIVTAPETATVAENSTLIVSVTASDPEGDGITSLTATGLPPGATFSTGPGDTTGTLNWTPGYTLAGSYTVTFTASNALSGTATTAITVTNVDRAPVVSAPATAGGKVGLPFVVNVTAADPDSEGITSLAAAVLPVGATFTPGSGNTTGTLSWTPASGQVGSYTVTFMASNALSGSASTAIAVTAPNKLPSASLMVTPSTGNAPLAIAANASASSDSDGTIVSYRFDFGDGTTPSTQTSPTASHSYTAGNWTATVTVTDNDGGTSSSSVPIIVAAVPPQPNLVGNPSFETDLTRWNAYASCALARVTGGFDGAYAVQATATGTTTASFGVNDSPDWVRPTTAAGLRYRFTVWVRSASSTGTAKISVREYSIATSALLGSVLSTGVPLSPTWQMVTVDYVTLASNSTLDFNVKDYPVIAGEVFLTDNLSIRNVTGAAAPAISGPALSASSEILALRPLEPRISQNPFRSEATLSFATSRPGVLRVDVVDLAGRRVRQLVDEMDAPAGVHQLTISANAGGASLGPGIYFYRIDALEGVRTGRFIILR